MRRAQEMVLYKIIMPGAGDVIFPQHCLAEQEQKRDQEGQTRELARPGSSRAEEGGAECAGEMLVTETLNQPGDDQPHRRSGWLCHTAAWSQVQSCILLKLDFIAKVNSKTYPLS